MKNVKAYADVNCLPSVNKAEKWWKRRMFKDIYLVVSSIHQKKHFTRSFSVVGFSQQIFKKNLNRGSRLQSVPNGRQVRGRLITGDAFGWAASLRGSLDAGKRDIYVYIYEIEGTKEANIGRRTDGSVILHYTLRALLYSFPPCLLTKQFTVRSFRPMTSTKQKIVRLFFSHDILTIFHSRRPIFPLR